MREPSTSTHSRPTRRSSHRPEGPPIVAPQNFLLATRDSGYRTTSSAIAELVDNSIQAMATSINVDVFRGSDDCYPVEIVVTDDGFGMTEWELASALTFGGSTRFGDRSSLGRYGMGLPNAALSCARRVEVYSWRKHSPPLVKTLDLDELTVSDSTVFPPLARADQPATAEGFESGTVVHLRRCDRLQNRRVSTIVKKLSASLGRTFRHFIDNGLLLRVNGDLVHAIDPLFLRVDSDHAASQFGEILTYHLSTAAGAGTVEVVFSELPIEAWHNLPATEKRCRGITNAANVSIVRASREVDSGWWFMGKKRRQNYDDWWRCEIRFDPVLDEFFGITHTKQQIIPNPQLVELLSTDLEPIANALNGRVRRRFELAKDEGPTCGSS